MKKYLFHILLLICTFALASWQPPQSGAGGLVPVVNLQGAPDVMSASGFRKIILGEQQRWSNGTKVTIALMKTSHPTGQRVAQNIYKMTGDELNKYWLGLVFQGRAKAPVFFNSEDDLLEFVAVTPGAIGIVSKMGTTTVKHLKVEGLD